MISACAAGPGELVFGPGVMLILGISIIIHFLPENWKEKPQEIFVRMPAICQGATSALVLGLLNTVGGTESPYYYFQF